ncbi:MAG: AAA family ATPase [Deltaproteobacteria bacterium]|nr:AAA family ATPase [Deltaproteobacteria bacterium]
MGHCRGDLRLTIDVQQREAWLRRGSNLHEWERLRDALALADDFVFLAAQVGDRQSEALLESLLVEWTNAEGLSLAGLPLDSTARASEVLAELRGAARPCMFWFPCADADDSGLDELFLLLNQKREVISELAAAPLVMAMPAQGWARFRRRAPDFWSVHQAVFRFSRGAEDSVPQPLSPSGDSLITDRWRIEPEGLIANDDERFIGRRTELDALAAMLATPGARVLVRGPRGIGKTSLLRQVCMRVAESYPDGIWWVPVADLPGGPRERARTILIGLLGEPSASSLADADDEALMRRFM